MSKTNIMTCKECGLDKIKACYKDCRKIKNSRKRAEKMEKQRLK